MDKVKIILSIVTALSFMILKNSMAKEQNLILTSGPVKIESDQDPVKKIFTLYQNEATEFNDVTRIQFDLNSGAYVILIVSDSNGNTVTNLIDGTIEAGHYSVYYKAAGIANRGKLFYTINVNGQTEIKSMIH